MILSRSAAYATELVRNSVAKSSRLYCHNNFAAHFCWKCSLSDALSYAKALHTFAGNALCLTHCPAQNRFALLLDMLFVRRIFLRKPASHFCWKCSLSDALSCAKPLRTFAGNALFLTHYPAQKRFKLLLEMLFV